MPLVKVLIDDNDKHVAGMVRALAFTVANVSPVKGAKNQQMEAGYLGFEFKTEEKAAQFRNAVATYLPGRFARVVG